MQPHNTIYIIGAGAIGKSLAVFLKNAGKDVILLRGSVDNIDEEMVKLKVECPGKSVEADVLISSLSSFDYLRGIVVLTNKSFGNDQLAKTLQSKIGSSPVVLLQNGLGIERAFLTAEFTAVYRCVLFVTSQLITNSSLRFKPVSICPIGIERGNTEQLESIVQHLNTPFAGFKPEINIQKIIWKKAIVNSVFNSICPLLEVDNGIFYREVNALEIARRIMAECITVANLAGTTITINEVEETLLQISKSSDGQLISTYQDILQGRETEIDTLNLEIARIAKEFQKSGQVIETNLLGELTKLKGGIHQRNS